MSTSALIAAKKRFETSLKKFEIPTTTDKAEEWVPQRYRKAFQHVTKYPHRLSYLFCILVAVVYFYFLYYNHD